MNAGTAAIAVNFGLIVSCVRPALVAAFYLTAIAPVWAADYGNPTDVAAVRIAVSKTVSSGAGACAVHANKIVVVDSYALVGEFFSDPCGGGGDELWAKRNGVWVDVLAGKPIIVPCDIESKGVSHAVILQLLSHYRGAAAVARAESELKNCQRDR